VSRAPFVETHSSSIPYVAPFGAYLGFLALRAIIPIPDLIDLLVRVVGMLALLYWVARPVLDFRAQRWMASVLIGIAVFAVWIAPDLLFPGYRHHWLFENAILGKAHASLSSEAQRRFGVLALRTLASAAIVPVIEELFWRAWLMRWLISPDFQKVPMGAYTRQSFWLVAVLFASEHGSYWDVGLVAGVAFNWWMIRTGSLGDLILTHAVANACLSIYVIAAGKWEYWL
jgi:uncharacterized protein